jgi:hypothetical protein
MDSMHDRSNKPLSEGDIVVQSGLCAVLSHMSLSSMSFHVQTELFLECCNEFSDVKLRQQNFEELKPW